MLLVLLALSPGAEAFTLRPSGAQSAAADSPFAGRWVANLERSERHENHQFGSAVLEIAVEGDTVTLAFGGQNASGNQESGEVVFEADGREHTVPGQPGGTGSAEWSGQRRLRTLASREGEIIGEGVYEVSADGTTLTATISAIDASGRHVDQVIVFDRQQP